jgi:hypothetical protein
MGKWGGGGGEGIIFFACRIACKFEPEEKNFVSGNFAAFSPYISSKGSAKLQWVGRVAHLG